MIRSTTNLVQIHVIAEDAQGQPITNLQRSNFQVLDDGKLQPLVFFEIDSATATPRADSAASPPAPAPDAESSYALILLDWINTAYVDRLRAQDHLIKYLKASSPRQHVGIYLLARQSQLLQDFTSDRDTLIATVQALPLGFVDDDTVPTGRFDARTAPARRLTTEEQIFAYTNKVNDSLRNFDTMAARLAAIPGRKSLLWISPGFPVTIGGGLVPGARQSEVIFTQDVERSLAKLNRADIAVYAVDPRGLPVSGGKGFPDTLMEIAARTGGTAFFNRNDLDAGMRMALEDSQAGYMLGFTVPPNEAPGFHEIRVRVNRSAVRLRYRESYRLQEPGTPAKLQP